MKLSISQIILNTFQHLLMIRLLRSPFSWQDLSSTRMRWTREEAREMTSSPMA
jgi:hypothetical protein